MFVCFYCTTWACRMLVQRPEIEPMPPAVEAWSLNHWTTREVPLHFFLRDLCSSQTAQRWKIRLEYRRTGFDPWVQKISWRREWQPTPAFLPGEFHGQRSLEGYSLWGHKESSSTEWLTLPLSQMSMPLSQFSPPSPFPHVPKSILYVSVSIFSLYMPHLVYLVIYQWMLVWFIFLCLLLKQILTYWLFVFLHLQMVCSWPLLTFFLEQ